MMLKEMLSGCSQTKYVLNNLGVSPNTKGRSYCPYFSYSAVADRVHRATACTEYTIIVLLYPMCN